MGPSKCDLNNEVRGLINEGTSYLLFIHAVDFK